MLSGIYQVTFRSSLGDFGGGLFVADNGALHGGDATYLYLGQFSAYANTVNAQVLVKHYRGPKNSIFGGLSNFRLLLTGVVNSDSLIRLSGHIEGASHHQITLNATRVSELYEPETEKDDF